MPKTQVEIQTVRERNRNAADPEIFSDWRPGRGTLRLGPDPEGHFCPLSIGRLVSFGIVPLLGGGDGFGAQSAPTPQATPS